MEATGKLQTYDWNQSEGLDCLVTAVLSWGHTTVPDLPRKKFTTHPINHFEQAPSDFAVSLSEHALRFQNHHFWLSEQDMTWHRPMQLYLRASGASKKKKSIDSIRRRVEREGRIFNQDWYESPGDNEVGSRHRPIDMLDIHQLQGENLEPFRHTEQQSGSYPNVQFGGSSSSTGRWTSRFPPIQWWVQHFYLSWGSLGICTAVRIDQLFEQISKVPHGTKRTTCVFTPRQLLLFDTEIVSVH